MSTCCRHRRPCIRSLYLLLLLLNSSCFVFIIFHPFLSFKMTTWVEIHKWKPETVQRVEWIIDHRLRVVYGPPRTFCRFESKPFCQRTKTGPANSTRELRNVRAIDKPRLTMDNQWRAAGDGRASMFDELNNARLPHYIQRYSHKLMFVRPVIYYFGI